MLLIKDLKDIQKKTEYLLTLAAKLTEEKHGALAAYDQHLFSAMSKQWYKLIKSKMEPDKHYMQDNTLISNEYREKIGARR